jgi:hypothetical protein
MHGAMMVSRGIHKMSLGTLAWRTGVERARGQDIDDVAAFVRGKNRLPFRPFARALGRWIDPEVGMTVRVERRRAGLRVAVQLYSVTLWSVLVGSVGDLLRELREVPGLLVKWSLEGAPERLSSATMLYFMPDEQGLLTAFVGPIPKMAGRVIGLNSFVRGATTPAIQVLDLSAPAWREVP